MSRLDAEKLSHGDKLWYTPFRSKPQEVQFIAFDVVNNGKWVGSHLIVRTSDGHTKLVLKTNLSKLS